MTVMKAQQMPTTETIITAKSVIQVRLLWGMPITIQIADPNGIGDPARPESVIDQVFDYFEYIDQKFSTYKPASEISLINQGALALDEASYDMRAVFALAEQLRQETGGYFNIEHNARYDPSGLVKGWAVSNAAVMIRAAGYQNFYAEAGGDFQAEGVNPQGDPWLAGIRSPFNPNEIVKVLSVSNHGVATSGTYIRGLHIYDPLEPAPTVPEILSMTVIGPDVCEADSYATAAFAMGRDGIGFIESLDGFEGYMIDSDRQATFTSGFERYVQHENN